MNPSPTELTTAATDAALGLLCLTLLRSLVRRPDATTWNRAIWGSVFGLLAAGSALGAIAHGLDLSAAVRTALWQPLYLSLGLTVALFVVGALGDWRGARVGRAALPWALAVGTAFYGLTFVSANFAVFIAYEAVAMLATLAVYLALWRTRNSGGAGTVAIGIGLTLAAAAVQASPAHLRIIWPFDHNGLFHLIQMVAVVIVARGLERGVSPAAGAGRP